MKNVILRLKLYWKPIVAVAGFSAMIIYAGGFLHQKVAPDPLASPPGQPLPPDATLFHVVKRDHAHRIEVVGTTASDRRIQLSARISAVADEVLVNAGDHVKAGQVLVKLDDRELREQLRAAESQQHQADTEYQRARQLFERQATTQQALTAAESAYHTARAQVERIQVMLTYAAITSPIDGIVTERLLEAGDLANPGQVLLTLFDPLNMRLEAPVPVRLIPKFSLGQEMVATLEYPSRSFAAVVSEIVGEIDPLTRTRRVKMKLLETGGDVLPGTYGRIWVEEDPRPALFIPSSALSRIGQLNMVNVVESNRMFRRLIKMGREQENEVEVISGLSGGEHIVMPPPTKEVSHGN